MTASVSAPALLAAAEATSCSIVMTDRIESAHPVSYVNHAFTTLTGYTADEVIGRDCRFLQGPETDRAVLTEIHDALRRGVAIRRQLLNYRKDGSSFWNDVMLDPIRDHAGDVTGYIGVQYDVSAFHSALQQHQTNERLLASIVDEFPGYVYRRVVDRMGVVH